MLTEVFTWFDNISVDNLIHIYSLNQNPPIRNRVVRGPAMDHREDHTTTSLLELVPSLEHSIVGILNHNGELNDQDSGRGYLVRVTNRRKFSGHHSH